jgi:hypothetical protein
MGVQWKMSPIEKNVWGAIRYLAVPLYPEFPVGRYFLDFGDQDKTWDAQRQVQIEAHGWSIIRIPSRMTYTAPSECYDADENFDCDRYTKECAEGLIQKAYNDIPSFVGGMWGVKW